MLFGSKPFWNELIPWRRFLSRYSINTHAICRSCHVSHAATIDRDTLSSSSSSSSAAAAALGDVQSVSVTCTILVSAAQDAAGVSVCE